MITVLYICSSYNLDGAARSLWNLWESVNERVKPIVFCIGEGHLRSGAGTYFIHGEYVV